MGNGPSTRNVVQIALAVAGTALALYLIYLIRGVLQLVVLGLQSRPLIGRKLLRLRARDHHVHAIENGAKGNKRT